MDCLRLMGQKIAVLQSTLGGKSIEMALAKELLSA
jgi:hypothetical protein